MSCCSHLWSREIWQPHKRASLFYFSVYICTRESLYIIKGRDGWLSSQHTRLLQQHSGFESRHPSEIVIGRQKQKMWSTNSYPPPKIYKKPKKGHCRTTVPIQKRFKQAIRKMNQRTTYLRRFTNYVEMVLLHNDGFCKGCVKRTDLVLISFPLIRKSNIILKM